MTTDPVVLPPDATVADALARVRQPELSPALAAQVYVCRPPLETPTGRYIGIAHIQRLLREPPSALVSGVVDSGIEPLRPDVPLGEITHHLATYNLVAVPVVDEDDHLLGAVTVDDVLDHLLPDDWRARDRAAAGAPATRAGGGAWRVRPARSSAARLDQPREVRRSLVPTPTYDPEAFGRLSERIARFIGTGRFLVYMTVFVVVWVIWNVVAETLIFDDYPFVFLTLILSLQASYAAPLILLAQNRQADRDRVQYEQDRRHDRAHHRRHRLPDPRAGVAADRGGRHGDPRLPALRAAPAAGGRSTSAGPATTARRRWPTALKFRQPPPDAQP